MKEKWSHLNKILSLRICSTPFAVFICLILIILGLGVFTGPGFLGWFIERIQNWIHLWF